MNSTNPASAKKSPRLFYGWLVVAGGFAVTFVGFGCVYSFSAFIDSLQQDFGASRGSVSLVFSLAGFLYFAVGTVSGPLADRFGSRRTALIGMILIGVGLALASMAQNLVQVYFAYGLGVGLGVGCSYVPAMGAVQRWFIKHRGFASGLAVERHRRRHAGGAAAGGAFHFAMGMARGLSRARRAGDLRRRRRGAFDRERSARSRAASGRRHLYRRFSAGAARSGCRSPMRSNRSASSDSMRHVCSVRSACSFRSSI